MKKRHVLLAPLIPVTAVPRFLRRREIARVAPELREGNPLLYLPMSVTNAPSLTVLRHVVGRATKPVSGVTVEERMLDEGLRVFVYAPHSATGLFGALVWLHGGGRVSGSPQADHRQCSYLAREAGVLVVSVDYRLAPEHPFPAGLDDIMTTLTWLHSAADSLGVDPVRVAVGGASAGGGLAAEAAQRAFDEGVPVAFQLLVYPMLDDRTVAVDEVGRGRLVWTPASNRYGWGAYLGHAAQDEPRPYAVAARRENLAGLPPAWIGVGDLDLFYLEDVEYAERLRAAGVAVELDVVPGMYHAADLFPLKRPPSMQAFWRRMAAALSAGVGRDSHF